MAIINGVAAAPFLIALMLVSSDRRIMGQHRNGRLASIVGWLTVTLMTVAAVAMFATGGG